MDIREQLMLLQDNHQLRSLKTVDRLQNGHIDKNGKSLVSFISNDYLGIASDRELHEDFIQNYLPANFHHGFSSASSRLLEGNASIFGLLEDKVAASYQKEACIFMNSGYHANLGVLSSLPQKGDLILSDKLNHASIVDGLKLSKAHFERYKHLDYHHLERLLEKNASLFRNIYIVSEALFSMDGDSADILKLVELKKKYNTQLIIDEAHSIGVYGENGLGLCEENNVINDIDVIIAPCGKALGGVGALVITSSLIKEYLVNHCRSFIFTTALPPINVAWLSFIWQQLPNYKTTRNKVFKLIDHFKSIMSEGNFELVSESYIQPFIVGENHKAIDLSNFLEEKGFYVAPIRYPTVPKNSARLRISITANHSIKEIDQLAEILLNYLKAHNYENELVD
ncbi:8-amino-7-oxononanoate synthase [Flammeovirga sp. SubArs3]|uniref:aminotransferase class I/II-fold pyridoxal phosphate-dependent enzyme n=1 Tax=Flammeovirga sp. SubArs3 TaxID=2995316 RepID=UPI00248ADE44|nr:8-amino-7-oxononanoate synthase [Flammeovirga sp. SubArs3]